MAEALHAVGLAVTTCRQRLEVPLLELPGADGATAWVRYVGPLGSRPRTIKLDISDSELVETHSRLVLQPRWPDLPADAAIQGYTLDEVAAEKSAASQSASNVATYTTSTSCSMADTPTRWRRGCCTCARQPMTKPEAATACQWPSKFPICGHENSPRVAGSMKVVRESSSVDN